uniref:Uncharacterized protein n=1 Tax=Dipterosiphonia australica TaxID=2007208 RepID=A0A1Z1ML96_9FLOR|nr:hypothetical protein [Dipterosiphonia australica]ARW66867.1 hypothetical protein [Dipterosiphonia australica]
MNFCLHYLVIFINFQVYVLHFYLICLFGNYYFSIF